VGQRHGTDLREARGVLPRAAERGVGNTSHI
jgi:hypothetical protein